MAGALEGDGSLSASTLNGFLFFVKTPLFGVKFLSVCFTRTSAPLYPEACGFIDLSAHSPKRVVIDRRAC